MKVLDKGHKYELEYFEESDSPGQVIKFINKETVKDTSVLTTIYDGTTNEDVLSMLIDRMSYLHDKFPCKENAVVITKLQESLMWLEYRTKDRKERNVEGKHLA